VVETENYYNLLGAKLMTLSETVQAFGVVGFKKALVAQLKSLAEAHKDFSYVTSSQISACRDNSPKCSYASGPQILTGADIYGAGRYSPFVDNTEEQNKGCLFGRAIATLGADMSHETSNIGCLLIDAGIDKVFSYKCWDIQAEQDGGKKWGELNISSLDGL
jgi:hypothetical protein